MLASGKAEVDGIAQKWQIHAKNLAGLTFNQLLANYLTLVTETEGGFTTDIRRFWREGMYGSP